MLPNEADRSNILAPGFRVLWLQNFTFFPPSPSELWLFCGGSRVGCTTQNCRRHACHHNASATIGSWEIVSSYSSATAPVSHRISRADPIDQTCKELIQQYRLTVPRSRFISSFRYKTAPERQNRALCDQSCLLFRQIPQNFVAVGGGKTRP